jgi:hypothetical protein
VNPPVFSDADDIIVSAQGAITPMEPGWKEARIEDVFSVGIQPVTYHDRKTGEDVRKDVAQFRCVCEYGDDGKVYWVERLFNATLGTGSSFLEALEELLDRPLTDAERRGFSVKSLVGMACRIRIDIAVKGPRTYFNIGKWAPAGPQPYTASGTYVRRVLTEWERAGLARARGEVAGQGQQPGARPPRPQVQFTPKSFGGLLQAPPNPTASVQNQPTPGASQGAANANPAQAAGGTPPSATPPPSTDGADTHPTKPSDGGAPW